MKAKIAALALLSGGAFFTTDVSATTCNAFACFIPSQPPATLSATCSTGNFTGEVKYRKGQDSYLRPWIEVTEYKITKRNGQQGGNKANINLYPYTLEPGPWPSWSSPDNLKQDGQWHNLGGFVKYDQWESPQYYHAKVKFIFDKSGNDPSCMATIN